MIIKLKAGDELEYCIFKVELGTTSYSFEPFTLKPLTEVDFTVPKAAIYIRLNETILKDQSMKEYKLGL